MKNRIALVFIMIFSLSFSACNKSKKNSSASSKKISIVCTMFPQYDWCRKILGTGNSNPNVSSGDFELTLLMNKGADLHNYQPTVSDLVKIQSADILIYVGGESDDWIRDALKSAKKEINAVSLIETLGEKAKFEEMASSFFVPDDEKDDEIEYDEHVWLSVRNAEFFVRKICSVICDIAGNKDFYWTNAENYIEELRKLDRDFSSVSESVILVADRFPFRYLVDDYDIKYFAAFPGCSAESEASFQTIVFLAEKVKEYNLPVVYTLENSDEKIAKSVIQTSGVDAKIKRLNSLQSITEKDIANGASYISLMLSNLYALSLSD